MSKIKNGRLDQYGAEPFEQQQFGTAGVEGVKSCKLSGTPFLVHAQQQTQRSVTNVQSADASCKASMKTPIRNICYTQLSSSNCFTQSDRNFKNYQLHYIPR